MAISIPSDALTDANAALARSGVCALVSQLLSYPTSASILQLREEDLPFARAVSGPLPAPVREAMERLVASLSDVTLELLEQDFRRIFSHVHSADCPLYETDFTAAQVWRQTRELADLSGFYRAFGLRQEAERPDHVSVEFEFLHVLAYKTAWSAIQGEAEHAEVCAAAYGAFLRDHVLRWIPAFLDRLAALSQAGPYAAGAELAAAFLRAEADRLGLPFETALEPPPSTADAGSLQGRGLCEQGP